MSGHRPWPPSRKSELLKNSPAGDHYKGMGIEPIEYIEANNLGFHEGAIVKYVSRWKIKNGLEDLKKAKFFIDRLIELEEKKPLQKVVLKYGDTEIVAYDPGDETTYHGDLYDDWKEQQRISGQ